MLTDEDKTHRTEFIAGLREMADWYEAHPDMRAPRYASINIFAEDKADFISLRRASGLRDKHDGDVWMYFSKHFRGELEIQINVEREKVCRRVQVGERVVPAQVAKPETVEPVYEWKCDSILEGTEQPAEATA